MRLQGGNMSRWLLVPVFGLTLVWSSLAHAAHWGALKDDGCKGPGYRQFSAILWGIPHGSNWEATCAVSPHLDWGPPTRCKNVMGINMWGEWNRPDPTCR
jgi:hypothetical protein